MLKERGLKLDEREMMIKRRFRLGKLRNREKRLSAREASLEPKLKRYLNIAVLGVNLS